MWYALNMILAHFLFFSSTQHIEEYLTTQDKFLIIMRTYILIYFVYLICSSSTAFGQEQVNFDSLKFKPLHKYRVEKQQKEKHIAQIMRQIQEANAIVIPDSLAEIMAGFPKEFMRKTDFRPLPKTKKITVKAHTKGRYRTYFRHEMLYMPDYKQELKEINP